MRLPPLQPGQDRTSIGAKPCRIIRQLRLYRLARVVSTSRSPKTMATHCGPSD